jgi:hypothetical protein
LIAVRRSTKENLFGSQAIPATAYLRLDGSLAELGRGAFKASLELHSAYENSHVIVKNQEVPLEKDTSVATAYKIAEEEA